MQSFIYVDYENMSNLKEMPKINGKYFFFIGNKQKSLPRSLVTTTNQNFVEWVEISGNGKNALDFHIAFFLGINKNEKNTVHYVLSKDKGYDVLINFIKNKYKVNIKRIEKICEIEEKIKFLDLNGSIKNFDVLYEKAISGLSKINQNNFPKSIKRLENLLKSILRKDNLSDKIIKRIANIIIEKSKKR